MISFLLVVIEWVQDTLENVGNTQRMGTELGLNGKLGNKWSWYGNYSYVRASFETSQNISSRRSFI